MATNTSHDLAVWITAADNRALLGQTPRSLRRYSFALDERARRITLKAEVDRPLSEEELEGLNVAETEMYAERFFDDDEVIETSVVVVPPSQALSPLRDGVVYDRDAAHAASG